MIDHRFITYKNSRISYYRWGNGPEIALCFHGYGETGKLFEFLDKYISNEFTFYSLDLPYHGETTWNESLEFSLQDLTNIVGSLVIPDGRGPHPRLTLVGFSLGGRVALSYYQANPEKTRKIVLLAPDGLKVNFWYWLSTQTLLGNKLFAFSMQRPAWFFALLKAFNRMKLVNASVFKFVNFYIGNPAARDLLYNRWTSLRKLKPRLAAIKKAIRKNRTPVRLLYGLYDRIILPVRGKKFSKGIEEFCTITVVHSGHQVVHEKHAAEIIPALLD